MLHKLTVHSTDLVQLINVYSAQMAHGTYFRTCDPPISDCKIADKMSCLRDLGWESLNGQLHDSDLPPRPGFPPGPLSGCCSVVTWAVALLYLAVALSCLAVALLCLAAAQQTETRVGCSTQAALEC